MILAIKLKRMRDTQNLYDNVETINEIYNIPEIENGESFLLNVMYCLLEEIEYLKSTTNHDVYLNSTIFVENVNVSIMDLNISHEEQQVLYQTGIHEAQDYLRSHKYLKLRFKQLPGNIQTLINGFCNKINGM